MIYNIIVYDNSGNVTDVISFSSVTQFNESYQSEVTENTVEYGFKIADHIVTKSPEISLEGIVSDYSIYNDALELYWNGDSFVSTMSESGSSVAGNFWNVKQSLIDIVQKRKLFTLILTEDYVDSNLKQDKAELLDTLKIQKFVNCVMPNLTFPVKNGVYGALFVNFSVRQIRIAKTVTEDVDKNSLKLLTSKKMTVQNGQAIGADGKPVDQKDDGSKEKTVQKDQCDQSLLTYIRQQGQYVQYYRDQSMRTNSLESKELYEKYKNYYESNKIRFCNTDALPNIGSYNLG